MKQELKSFPNKKTSEKPSFSAILSSDQIAREHVDSATLTFSQLDLPKNSSKNPGFSEVFKKDKEFIRSFGRIKSRKLSDQKEDVLAQGLQNYEIKDFFFVEKQKSQKNILEIGFGFGDFLSVQIKKNPNINFIGAETHINGLVSLFSKLENKQLNLKIFREDVRILLKNLPDEFFDEVFILFPDPWPKSKHFKRRLINVEFLQILSKKMAKNGHLTVATDHDSYKTWILSMILRSNYFELVKTNSNLFEKMPVNQGVWNKEDCLNFPQDWVETKYQRKAILEGRVPVIFNLVKV